MIAGLLTSPLALALIALLAVGGLAVIGSGALKRHDFEARFGLAALCAMKWQDFARLVTTFLGERGLLPSPRERKFGDGGFDLLLERGTSSYLVICKNANNHEVSRQTIVDLQKSIQHHEAEGAVVAACGPADAMTMDLARSRGIEVVAGAALWRQVRHLLPYDVRDDAEAAAKRESQRRLILSGFAGLLAAVLTWLLVAWLTATPAAPSPATTAEPTATPSPVAAPASAPAAAAPPTAPPATAPLLPDPTLTEAQLETRRATAAMEVRSIPGIDDADWSTKSTLAIALPASTEAIPETLIADICRILLQYEEQRFTRLQLDVAAASPDAPAVAVRWRQCR